MENRPVRLMQMREATSSPARVCLTATVGKLCHACFGVEVDDRLLPRLWKWSENFLLL